MHLFVEKEEEPKLNSHPGVTIRSHFLVPLCFSIFNLMYIS
jgi:hypothetical protein